MTPEAKRKKNQKKKLRQKQKKAAEKATDLPATDQSVNISGAEDALTSNSNVSTPDYTSNFEISVTSTQEVNVDSQLSQNQNSDNFINEQKENDPQSETVFDSHEDIESEMKDNYHNDIKNTTEAITFDTAQNIIGGSIDSSNTVKSEDKINESSSKISDPDCQEDILKLELEGQPLESSCNDDKESVVEGNNENDNNDDLVNDHPTAEDGSDFFDNLASNNTEVELSSTQNSNLLTENRLESEEFGKPEKLD